MIVAISEAVKLEKSATYPARDTLLAEEKERAFRATRRTAFMIGMMLLLVDREIIELKKICMPQEYILGLQLTLSKLEIKISCSSRKTFYEHQANRFSV